MSKDAHSLLYLCSSLLFLLVCFFLLCRKNKHLDAALLVCIPCFFLIQLSVQLSYYWWVTLTDHSSEKHRGGKETGCLASSNCLIFKEWENGVLYMEAAASPVREADLDTLVMEAFALMWCKVTSGKRRAMADRSITILDSSLKTSHTKKSFSRHALSHDLEALWQH